MSGLQRQLYEAAPAAVQNLLVSAYGLARRRKRFGGDYLQLLEEGRAAWRLDVPERERRQLTTLRRVLRRAGGSVPFYRELFERTGFDPEQLASLDDLARLPVLTKATVREQGARLHARPDHTFWVNETSGSTGTPLTVHLSAEAYRLTMALLTLHEEECGIEPSDRRATFAGRMVQPVTDDRPPFWRFNLAERQMLCSAYHMADRHLPLYIEALERFRPAEIIGYPSAIATLAAFCLRSGHRPDLPLRAVITNSETLLEWQRATIEEALGAPVRDYYGTAEAVVFAGTCREGRYHPHPAMGIVEVLDDAGAPAAPGTPGRLVCTTLCNTAMPLVRYEIGDMVVPARGPCACGRTGTSWSAVLGRIDDVVTTPEGRSVGRLDHVFKGVTAIREAQIAHTAPEAIVIRVVPDAGYSPDIPATILRNARERLGDGMRIEVEAVEEIPRGSRGKFRGVVREF
jgi:phenylacetate-CoA ligase